VKGDYSLIPTHYGGSQEIKRRGGTENTIGIIGFGAACALLDEQKSEEKLKGFQRYFEQSLQENLQDIEINCQTADRIPNTSNVRFKGISSEVLLSALDLEDICVSAGSACSSGSISPSTVLLELGLKEAEAKECLRISWGTLTTLNEVECVVKALTKHVNRIRARKEQNA
jgi:cysteine desulfurase